MVILAGSSDLAAVSGGAQSAVKRVLFYDAIWSLRNEEQVSCGMHCEVKGSGQGWGRWWEQGGVGTCTCGGAAGRAGGQGQALGRVESAQAGDGGVLLLGVGVSGVGVDDGVVLEEEG